ncbi:MAG: 2-amino-4-hydroxy-6-hydroxymethyldihydropteridine diphosphokinase [Chitinophagaceae bacterium]
MQYSNTAFLLIGGNIGDRRGFLNQARSLLELHSGKEVMFSCIYETAAWGKEDQSAFLNQALALSTTLTAEELLKNILHAEIEIGRERREKYGARIIDIDILFFNNEIYNLKDLVIPHQQLPYRRFALKPLAEIAPDFIHPVLNKSVVELLEECTDPLDVTVFDD